MGTCWEHIVNKKKQKVSLPPPFSEKKPVKEKTKCLEPFPWLHEIFILKNDISPFSILD